MFDPPKAFLLRRGDEFAIDKQARSGIAVITVETEDVHPKNTEDREQRTAKADQNMNAATIPKWRMLRASSSFRLTSAVLRYISRPTPDAFHRRCNRNLAQKSSDES